MRWGFFKNKNLWWQHIPLTLAIISYEGKGMVKIHWLVQNLQPKSHKNNYFGDVLGVWGDEGFSKIKKYYVKTFQARWQSYAMKEWWRFIHSVKSYSQKTIKHKFLGGFRGMGSWRFFKNKNLLWQNIPRTLAIICHEGMLKIHSLVQKLQPKNHKNKFFGGVLAEWGHGGF